MNGDTSRLLLIARIRQIARGNTSMVFGTTLAVLAIRMVGSLVLTRLLSPDVYGTAAIIISVTVLLALLSDLGFHAYIVRHPAGDNPAFLNALWTIHVLRGFLLTLISIVLAPFLATLFQKPEITLPFAVVSLQFLLNGFASLGPIVILRSGRVGRLCAMDITTTAFQTCVSIAAASILNNVWSIVASVIAQSLLSAAMSYSLFPSVRHGFVFDKAVRTEFFRFSRIVMISSGLTLLIGQADKLALARALTLEEFGLYSIALSLASVASTFASNYINRVAYPLYAKAYLSGGLAIKQAYYGNGRRVVSLFYAFGTGALATSASIPISILYDARYSNASLYLAILMVGSMFALNAKSSGDMLTAVGEISRNTKGNCVRLVWLLCFVPILFLSLGSVGIIVAFGTIEIPAMIYFWLCLRRLGILDWKEEGLQGLAAFAGLSLGAVIQTWVGV